jgi:hypothetical protein
MLIRSGALPNHCTRGSVQIRRSPTHNKYRRVRVQVNASDGLRALLLSLTIPTCKFFFSVSYSPAIFLIASRISVNIISSEISGTDLRVSIPRWQHLYAVPFLPFYPLLAYAYYVKYNEWLRSEEWTFLACVLLGASHSLSFLVTRWSARAKAWVTTRKVRAHHVLVRLTQMPIPTLGPLTCRSRLYSHPPCPSPWAGRNRAPYKTRSL